MLVSTLPWFALAFREVEVVKRTKQPEQTHRVPLPDEKAVTGVDKRPDAAAHALERLAKLSPEEQAAALFKAMTATGGKTS